MLFSQSYPILCDPVDCSSPGSSVHGILQARILEWVTISFSRESSLPRDPTQISCTAGRFFAIWATRETPKYQSRYGIQNAMKKLNKHTCLIYCVCVCVCVQWLSCVRHFVTPWTVVHQVPLFMEFFRQEYWSGVPFPTPGNLPYPGIKLTSLASPALGGRFFTIVPPGKPRLM